MTISIGVVVVATFALAAVEVGVFWVLGERDDRRRRPPRPAPELWPDRRSPPGERTTIHAEPALGAGSCTSTERTSESGS
jgi:hypothetical protein